MKAKRVGHAPKLIAIYDAKNFSSVLIDEEEAQELVEALKRLGITAPNCEYCNDRGCDYCSDYSAPEL